MGKKQSWGEMDKSKTPFEKLRTAAYRLYNQTSNKSPRTTHWYDERLRLFQEFIGEGASLQDLNVENVRVLHKLPEGLSVASLVLASGSPPRRAILLSLVVVPATLALLPLPKHSRGQHSPALGRHRGRRETRRHQAHHYRVAHSFRHFESPSLPHRSVKADSMFLR